MIDTLTTRIVGTVDAVVLKFKRGQPVETIDYSGEYILASSSIVRGTARLERLITEEQLRESSIGYMTGFIPDPEVEVLIIPACDVIT